MSGPVRGRADYFAPGDWNAVCYECGRKRKASTLKRHWQGYYVCPEHWEPRHPQDFARGVQDVQTPGWTQPMNSAVVPIQYIARIYDDARPSESIGVILPPRSLSDTVTLADALSAAATVSAQDSVLVTDDKETFAEGVPLGLGILSREVLGVGGDVTFVPTLSVT
jgi:hypothetical protein